MNDVLNLLPLIDSLKPEIDPARIGMEGWSRGGIMTYLALSRTRRIAAAIIGSGDVDLAAGIKLRPEMETNVIAELVPGYATNKVQALRDRSAINWPEQLAKDTPILLLGGAADWRINPRNSLRMAEKLYQARHAFRLVMFEGGVHHLSEFRDERLRISLDWFNTYLRDRKPWPVLSRMDDEASSSTARPTGSTTPPAKSLAAASWALTRQKNSPERRQTRVTAADLAP